MSIGATPVRRRRRWRILLIGTASAALIVSAAIAWLARGESGSAWLLARLPGVTASGISGRLSGGPFAAERVDIAIGQTTVSLRGLVWQDAQWSWRPHDGAWYGLALIEPHAQRVDTVSYTHLTLPTKRIV